MNKNRGSFSCSFCYETPCTIIWVTDDNMRPTKICIKSAGRMELAEVIDYEIHRIYSSFQTINSPKDIIPCLLYSAGIKRGTIGQGAILYAEIMFEDSGKYAHT